METTKEETKKEKMVRVECELKEPSVDIAILAKFSQDVVKSIPRMNDAPSDEKEIAFSAVFGALRAAHAMGKDTARIKSKWEKVNDIFGCILSILICVVLSAMAAVWILRLFGFFVE